MTRNPQGSGRQLPVAKPGFLAANKVSLGVIVVGAAFIIGGIDLGFPSGRFPIILGGMTVALAILEIVGNTFFIQGAVVDRKGPLLDRAEITAVLWLLATILMILIGGILLGSFLSTLVFTWFIEKRRAVPAVLIPVVNTFVIWFAFSYLAGFELYQGVFG